MKKVKLLSIALFVGLLAGSASAQQASACSVHNVCSIAPDIGTFSFASLDDHLPYGLKSTDDVVYSIEGLRFFDKVTSYQGANYVNSYLWLNWFTDVNRNGYLWAKDRALQDTDWRNATSARLYSSIPAGIYQAHIIGGQNYNDNGTFRSYPVSDITFRDVYGPIPGIPYYTGFIKKYNYDMTGVFGTLTDSRPNTYTNILRRSGFSCVKVTTGYGLHQCFKTVGNVRYGWRFTDKNTSDTFIQRL